MTLDLDNKQRELAKSISEHIPASVQVVYLADTNHFRQTEVYGAFTGKPFWDEMGRNGKSNVLAIEKYPTSIQPVFDAYFKKEITRDEFLSCFDIGSNTGQSTASEDKIVLENLADVMDQGVHIIAANNMQGLGGENGLRAEGEGMAHSLDRVHWLRNKQAEIDVDPTSIALSLMENADPITKSKALNNEYIAIKKTVLDKIENGQPLDTKDVIRLYDVTNPHYANYLDHLGKAEPDNFDIKYRRSRDDQVVETIQRAIKQDARVFFLYGVGHAGGPDGIMAQLRQNNIEAQLIVPYLGKDHFACLKPDNETCKQLEKNHNAVERYIEGSLKDNTYTKIPDINSPFTKIDHKAPGTPLGPN